MFNCFFRLSRYIMDSMVSQTSTLTMATRMTHSLSHTGLLHTGRCHMTFYFLLHHQYKVKCSVCFLTLGCNLLLLHVSLLPCSIGSSVRCLKTILSRASLFISAKVFPFLLATSITRPPKSSLVFFYLFFSPVWLPLPVLVSIILHSYHMAIPLYASSFYIV